MPDNFWNLIGLGQWYFSYISNHYMKVFHAYSLEQTSYVVFGKNIALVIFQIFPTFRSPIN